MTTRPDRAIETPWLRVDEAAAYCGMSRSTFEHRAGAVDLPYGGDARFKLYHVHILDAWISNALPNHPFVAAPAPAEEDESHRRRRRPSAGSAPAGLIDPVTGRFYPAGGRRLSKLMQQGEST